MRGAPKVSLIIPVYNVGPYLARCLDSCVRQTLLDLEILCVNDGSTDRSREILGHYAGLDCRIRILDRENGGVSSARNAGLDAANGEWIMFLDADDYLEPDACERVWAESLERKTDLIIFGGTIFPDAPEQEDDDWLLGALRTRAVRFRAFEPAVLFSEAGAEPFIWQKAYSAAFLERNKLRFDETLPYGEDVLFLFSLFPLAGGISFLSETLYHYRVRRPGSLTERVQGSAKQAQGKTDAVDRRLMLSERILLLWESYGIAKRYGYEFGQWILRFNAKPIEKLRAAEKPLYLERVLALLKRHDLGCVLRELPIVQRKWIRQIRAEGKKERAAGRAAHPN